MADTIARGMANTALLQLRKSYVYADCAADGVTDDSAVIQSTLDGMTAGQTLILPANCLVKNKITVNVANIVIFGGGLVSGLGNLPGGSPSSTVYQNLLYILYVHASGVRVEGLTITNPQGYSYNGGIWIQASNVTVQGCTIDNFTEPLLCDQGHSQFSAIGNVITNVVGIGSENIGDGIANFSPLGVIDGNTVTAASGTDARVGIVCDITGTNSTVTGNTVTGAFRRSIHIELSDNTSVIGNGCEGATTWGVRIVSNAVLVQGNTIQVPSVNPPVNGQDTAGHGINVYHGYADTVIDGNDIIGVGSGSNGITAGSSNTTIANNIIRGTSGSIVNGIYISGSELIVNGNRIESGVVTGRGINAYTCTISTLNGNIIEKTGINGIDLNACTNCVVSSNITINNASYGIVLEGGCVACTVADNQAFDNQGTKTQINGILLNGITNSLIQGNNVSGNINSGVGYSGTNTGTKVKDNTGYNPIGSASAPAVPTSGTALSNPKNYPCRVFISGGTVTGISINGASTGLTSGSFYLEVTDSITLTYSTAPTWAWFGL